jgi:low affinity Fe/Cu permease
MRKKRPSVRGGGKAKSANGHGLTALASDRELRAHRSRNWFTRFAHTVARLAGKPATFLIALACVLAWALSGPIFGYSDTWQLVVNTATTIVTFLMVFLIQSTQNRDTLALQIKLADLIIAMRGTHNDMANAEDMSETELESLHEEYRRRADQAHSSLQKRRSRAA